MDNDNIDRVEISNITLILFFKVTPTLQLFQLEQCISNLEPLLGRPEIHLQSITPLSLWIKFEQKDPHHRGLPHIHNIHVTDNHPVSAPRSDLEDAAQLRCRYYSGGSETPEPIIALYKVAFAFAQQDLLALWDPAIDLIHPTEYVTRLFQGTWLQWSRAVPPFGLWINLMAFERPGGGVWFYTKGFYRFGMAEFAYLGAADDYPLVCQLFSQLFATLFQSYQLLQVGDVVPYRPGIWITAGPVLEYQEILNGPLGTLVLQPHQEDGAQVPLEDTSVNR
jgi:hypothetical protein